jgi:hypothetical protein
MKKNEFKCDQCGEVFNKAWTDEEAWAEAEPLKDEIDKYGLVTVCDDCYKIIMRKV